jgi:hypothetical protein
MAAATVLKAASPWDGSGEGHCSSANKAADSALNNVIDLRLRIPMALVHAAYKRFPAQLIPWASFAPMGVHRSIRVTFAWRKTTAV